MSGRHDYVVGVKGDTTPETIGIDFVAATPAAATSTIIMDNTTYKVHDIITVAVSLKDAQSHSVSGAATSLNNSYTVTVPNTTQRGNLGWTESGTGIYSVPYRGDATGTVLKASMRLSGWSSVSELAAYTIIGLTIADIDCYWSTSIEIYCYTMGPMAESINLRTSKEVTYGGGVYDGFVDHIFGSAVAIGNNLTDAAWAGKNVQIEMVSTCSGQVLRTINMHKFNGNP